MVRSVFSSRIYTSNHCFLRCMSLSQEVLSYSVQGLSWAWLLQKMGEILQTHAKTTFQLQYNLFPTIVLSFYITVAPNVPAIA